MKSRSKLIVVCVLGALILVCGVGTVGYRQYSIHLLKEKLNEAMGRDSGLTETILRIETDSPKMSYVEVFQLCDQSIANRTAIIVELRGLYPGIDYQMKERLADYLTSENEFVRSKRNFYRDSLGALSAVEAMGNELKAMQLFYSPLLASYTKNRMAGIKDEFTEKAVQGEASATEFLSSYNNMVAEESSMSAEAARQGVRLEPIFQKYREANEKHANETKRAEHDSVQSITASLENVHKIIDGKIPH